MDERGRGYFRLDQLLFRLRPGPRSEVSLPVSHRTGKRVITDYCPFIRLPWRRDTTVSPGPQKVSSLNGGELSPPERHTH